MVNNLSEKQSGKVWEMVNHKDLTNSQKDLAWMMVSKCLPVKQFQHARKLAKTARCPTPGCAADESLMHFIWNCGGAQSMWKAMGQLIKELTGQASLSYELVLYGLGMNCNANKERTLWRIINCVKEAMWENRNLSLYKHQAITEKECQKLVFTKMFSYMCIDTHRFGQEWAKETWKIRSWSGWVK